MPVDRWVDLAEDFGEPTVPGDLREQIEQHVARLQAEGGGTPKRSPRWPSVGRWIVAGVGVVLVIGALALAAHTRRDQPASVQTGHVDASVVLLGQQGRSGNGSAVDWRTKQQARVTCGAHPAVTSSAGNNGIRPSELCRALAYYSAHSTESPCSYASHTGVLMPPSRVLVNGTINGQTVHLDMGMRCNPTPKLAATTGLIWATVFGEGNAVKANISESTFTKLTEIAQRQAQALGDPSVHNAQLVLTTRRRMNSGLGIGYQASQDQSAKVFVIQFIGTFTCNTCSFPAGGHAPTGSAAQDVLSYGSLSGTDFGLTKRPVVMQRMGPIMTLSWKPEPQPEMIRHRMVGNGPRQVAGALGTSHLITSARIGRYGKDRAVLVGVNAHGVMATTEAEWSAWVIAAAVMRDCQEAGGANCPTLFAETAPNGSKVSAGRMTLSHDTFPPTLPGVGEEVARRVAAVGLRATSIEVDDVGVVVVIVHAVADDPAKAVRTKAEERSVAIPGLAATLVEISDTQGNLVSISGTSNLGQFGMAWTSPKYRALVPNQMSGTYAQPVS